MDQLQGVVTGVRHTTSVVSPGNEQPTSTVHIALFRINGQAVEMQTSKAIGINEGDQVLVVGASRNGVFKALAHRNYTTGASHAENWWFSAAVSLFMCGVGVNFMLTAASGHEAVPVMLFGAVGVAAGLFFLRRSWRMRLAARIVNAAG